MLDVGAQCRLQTGHLTYKIYIVSCFPNILLLLWKKQHFYTNNCITNITTFCYMKKTSKERYPTRIWFFALPYCHDPAPLPLFFTPTRHFVITCYETTKEYKEEKEEKKRKKNLVMPLFPLKIPIPKPNSRSNDIFF